MLPAHEIRSVCVYCGSNSGRSPAIAEAARSVGRILGGRGLRLVYGGGNVGLMGIVADAALEAGGEVYGVIPAALADRELAHAELTELYVVESMHRRKAKMAELADAFIALPGGIGTLDELFEIWTWGQLAFHKKPIGLLVVGGFYAPLLQFLDGQVEHGFLRAEHRAMLQVATDCEELFMLLSSYHSQNSEKWLKR